MQTMFLHRISWQFISEIYSRPPPIENGSPQSIRTKLYNLYSNIKFTYLWPSVILIYPCIPHHADLMVKLGDADFGADNLYSYAVVTNADSTSLFVLARDVNMFKVGPSASAQ